MVFPMPDDVGNVTIYCTSLTESFFLCVFVASSRGTISMRKSNNSFLEIAAATSFLYKQENPFVIADHHFVGQPVMFVVDFLRFATTNEWSILE